ncbi:Cystin-1 [Varanus komodoensis]|nr:Cystin-1 [Varanus komodoensis]
MGSGSSRAAKARSRHRGEPDSDSELLDRMLEECDDGRPELPGRRPPRLDAGDFCSRPAGGGAGKREDGIPREERVFLARSIQESNDFANQVPLRKPEMQAKVSYDYSEEELMAIIEQEYCR